MKHLLFKKMLMTVVMVSLGVAAIACRGPEGPAGPLEIATLEPRSVLVVSPVIVSKKGGEVTISGSGFIPGDAIWIKIASADADERDVDLTKDLIKINEHGAFAITVNCKEALKGVVVKKQGVFVVKAVSGKQRAATAPIVITE